MGRFFAVAVGVITLVSVAVFASRVWWMPPDASAVGPDIDRQLRETMAAVAALFVASQLALATFVWRSSDRRRLRPVRRFPGGALPLVVVACLLVGGEILALTLVGSTVWARIFAPAADPHAVRIEVLAEQFAYYFRYAGRDGKFGRIHPDLISDANENYFGLDPARDTAARDDIVVPTLTIPVNRPIALSMRAKDVGHSFYVPELRVQQDFVPGMVIPLHFIATRTGRFELVCTQLCGLGHYNMRAYVEVVPQDRFDHWLEEQAP